MGHFSFRSKTQGNLVPDKVLLYNKTALQKVLVVLYRTLRKHLPPPQIPLIPLITDVAKNVGTLHVYCSVIAQSQRFETFRKCNVFMVFQVFIVFLSLSPYFLLFPFVLPLASLPFRVAFFHTRPTFELPFSVSFSFCGFVCYPCPCWVNYFHPL